jgi:hypothetical protein
VSHDRTRRRGNSEVRSNLTPSNRTRGHDSHPFERPPEPNRPRPFEQARRTWPPFDRGVAPGQVGAAAPRRGRGQLRGSAPRLSSAPGSRSAPRRLRPAFSDQGKHRVEGSARPGGIVGGQGAQLLIPLLGRLAEKVVDFVVETVVFGLSCGRAEDGIPGCIPSRALGHRGRGGHRSSLSAHATPYARVLAGQ